MADLTMARPERPRALAKLVRRPAALAGGALGRERVDGAALDGYLAGLGEDAAPSGTWTRRRRRLASVLSLSSLTAPLALDYLDRLARPIPALTPETGVQIVSRAYVAHLVTEDDPAAFGAVDVPVARDPAAPAAGFTRRRTC